MTTLVDWGQYVRTSDAAPLNALYAVLHTRALAAEGPRAFEATPSAAAHHEAGHCVEYGLAGLRPTRARIWAKVVGNQTFWEGRTECRDPSWSDHTTTPANDLSIARSQIAGALAELIFDRANFRAGSSIDEITIALALVSNAAHKLGCSFKPLWLDMLAALGADLKTHEAVVREIADVLMRCGSIAGSRLQRALAGVKPPSDTKEFR
jgi:hypothetical protein